jgi:hypothetical protein
LPNGLVWVFAQEEFAVRDAPRIEFEGRGQRQEGIIPAEAQRRLGVAKSRDPLVDSEQRAHGENINRDQEGIEVEHLAVPERI